MKRSTAILVALAAALTVGVAADEFPGALAPRRAHGSGGALAPGRAPAGAPARGAAGAARQRRRWRAQGHDPRRGGAPGRRARTASPCTRPSCAWARRDAAGSRMAIIKLQAGTRRWRVRLADLRSDAAICMRAAFNVALGFDHLDLWSVVPGAAMVGDQQEHLPGLLALGLARGIPRGLAGGGQQLGDPGPARWRALQPGLPALRADGGDARALPASAVTDAPLAESWDGPARRGRRRPRRRRH